MKQILPLALIAALRFFGLFIILPVIGLYADIFHTSAFLAGLAAGGYAITQILFQTPFGVLSDKFNRKNIIAIGLVIFLFGSLICALSSDITMLIIGRFLQGAGAIGGVVSAQIADLVKEEERNKAMAIMGAFIFASFILAMLLSPILASAYGVNMLFWLTALLCVISLLILYLKVPNAPSVAYHYHNSSILNVLTNKNMLIMHLSAFLQKFLMIFAFVCVSLALTHSFDMPDSKLYLVYAPAALFGILAMGPMSILAQKRGQFKAVMLFGIICFVIAYFLMALALESSNLVCFVCGVIIFFVGFAVHEPIMQSLASRYPLAHQKGAALGIFTTLGYVGSALGGILGGILYEYLGLFYLAQIIALICVIWGLVLMLYLSNPKNHKNLYLPSALVKDKLNALDSSQGVIEWYINTSQNIAIIKYDDTIISKEQIFSTLGYKE